MCQVLSFVIAANYAPGVHVDGWLTALIASFVYAIINTLLTAILGIDRGGSYYGLLVQRLMVKRSKGHTDKPGLVIIQIDGLAHPILAARMRAGSVNTIANWVRDGSHKLSRWEAILPSMTSASQAGILHGNNDGIPAFRWYERDRQHLMASSNPVDATLIVSRISNGEGLLSNNGASICNLMTGDATRSYLTTASIKAEGGGIGDSKAFMSFFFSPTGYLRSFTLFLGEFFTELIQARRTRRSGIRPQMHRGMKYAGMRAASNVLLRDVNTALIIEEMYRGTNVIYADFTDYDELAHHCGPERVESFTALDGVDQAIATLVKATDEAPRPYKFIVLSDHGQSLGETFLQRYGVSLGEFVRSLMSGRATILQAKTQAEGSTFVNSFLSEITQSKGVGPTVARAALASKTHRWRRRPRRRGGPATGRRRGVDRGRRLGQPRARVVHRPRPAPHRGGARGAPPGPGGRRRRPSRRRPCCSSDRRRSVPSCSVRRGPASSTRTGSRARIRRPSSGRTRS